MYKPSVRAEVITRRTYCRPKPEGGVETWAEVVDRVISHQRWLWTRAIEKQTLTASEILAKNTMSGELDELKQLLLERKVSVSGRTLWLGGTEIAKTREASQFNCAHLKVETVHDVVDSLWLLLQGCGVGFTPVVGTLSGFTKPIKEIQCVRSKRKIKGGRETNTERTEDTCWTIVIGDSAEAWAKSIGKLLAGKNSVSKLVLDFSNLRPAGERLSGYGWISSGDSQISVAFKAIAGILNRRAGQLLRRMDILDIMNWLGTILSSRRSAEIALVYYNSPEWYEFADAKSDLVANTQRVQSNNSLVFWEKPSEKQLYELFEIMQKGGGSEPGFINGEAARKRAPWFAGVNPCAEILLGNKSFCNLSEVDLGKFREDNGGLDRAIYITARANYRQTLVNLDDGILQRTWHENNEYLRLCGVGLTGIALRNDLSEYDYKRFKNIAVYGAYSMADMLGTQRPKNVTTVKPSGTLSKIMDTTEGCHKPLGRYIFNNVNFGIHDPIVPSLKQAGYSVTPNPTDKQGLLVRFPVDNGDCGFYKDSLGREVCRESAIEQLERYRLLMREYVEHNCSITVSYKYKDIPQIVNWLMMNWDNYVGVAFMLRDDNTYAYLPQEVVTKEAYEEYVSKLSEVDFSIYSSKDLVLPSDKDLEDECLTGACPIK